MVQSFAGEGIEIIRRSEDWVWIVRAWVRAAIALCLVNQGPIIALFLGSNH